MAAISSLAPSSYTPLLDRLRLLNLYLSPNTRARGITHSFVRQHLYRSNSVKLCFCFSKASLRYLTQSGFAKLLSCSYSVCNVVFLLSPSPIWNIAVLPRKHSFIFNVRRLRLTDKNSMKCFSLLLSCLRSLQETLSDMRVVLDLRA